eukprot:UN3785
MPPIFSPWQSFEQPTPKFMLLVFPYGNPLVMLGSLFLPPGPSFGLLALFFWEQGVLEVCVTEFFFLYGGEGGDCIRGGSLPLPGIPYKGESPKEPPLLGAPRGPKGSHCFLESPGGPPE